MTSGGAATASSARRACLVGVGVAVAAAFVARVCVGLAVNVDAAGVHRGFDFYGFMADHVLDGRGLVWSFYDDLGDKWANRAPLYPLVVAAARWAFGRATPAPVVVVQAALGALGCIVPAALAARWGGWKAAVIAAWAAALWPYSIVLDTGLVEHVVYAPLVGLSVLLSLRAGDDAGPGRSVVAGAVAGLAVLARLTFGATAAMLCAVAAFSRPRIPRAVLFAVGAAVVLAPWVARNHAVTGAWTLGTDGGRALWVGNAPETFVAYPAKSIDDAERAMFASLSSDAWSDLRSKNDDEVAQDAAFRARALDAVSARPASAAWGGVRKAAALWSPVMNPGPVAFAKLVLFGLTTLCLLAGAVVAAARVPRIRADVPTCAAAVASFTLVAAVFWGQSRYLAPLHGIAIAAAAAWIATRRDARRACVAASGRPIGRPAGETS
jgi:hypothetical protein